METSNHFKPWGRKDLDKDLILKFVIDLLAEVPRVHFASNSGGEGVSVSPAGLPMPRIVIADHLHW